jgi:membrane-associated phospholipid phosphatase
MEAEMARAFGRATTAPQTSSIAISSWAAAWTPSFRNRLTWAFWFAAISVELSLLVVLAHGRIYGWEQDLTREIQSLGGDDTLFKGVFVLTNTLALEFVPVFLAAFGGLWLWGRRLEAGLLVLTLPLHVLSQFPKALIDRPRPSAEYEGIVGIGGGQSFPSGHSEFVVTFYGFLAFVLFFYLQRPWQRATVVSGFLSLALLTGYGRISEGRHWPVDVACSFLLGAAVVSGLVWLHGAIREGRRNAA